MLTTRVLPDAEKLAEAACGLVLHSLRSALATGPAPASLVLAGGGTPERLYRRLAASSTAAEALDWQRIHLFWGDERFVPADHPASNQAMARRTLVDHVPIPDGRVHPIPTGQATPDDAAGAYEYLLRSLLAPAADGSQGLFDLVLLGLGADGHTASLFPERAPAATRRAEGDGSEGPGSWVTAVTAPTRHSPRRRISMTTRALSRSRQVVFLVSGKDKRRAVEAALGPDRPVGHPSRSLVGWPLEAIRPRDEVVLLLDREAAPADLPVTR